MLTVARLKKQLYKLLFALFFIAFILSLIYDFSLSTIEKKTNSLLMKTDSWLRVRADCAGP